MEGWLSRMGKAFLAIPIGLSLFAVAFVVLFWNEGRAVHTAQGLAEGKSSVVPIQEPTRSTPPTKGNSSTSPARRPRTRP